VQETEHCNRSNRTTPADIVCRTRRGKRFWFDDEKTDEQQQRRRHGHDSESCKQWDDARGRHDYFYTPMLIDIELRA
jgi:hypothetical protein